MKKHEKTTLLWILLTAIGSPIARAESAESDGSPPNMIIILSDDQGYGDLGRHGNPVLRTPNLDRLYDESVHFTNFHVSPTCSPTRAALMTVESPWRASSTQTISTVWP